MLNVTIVNGDVRDLFVTVVDLNLAVEQTALSAARLNAGQSRAIAIQDDGDGLGHLRWQVNVADDPSTGQAGEAARLSEGDTIAVRS